MKIFTRVGIILVVMVVMTLVVAGCDAGPTEEQDDDFAVEGTPTLDVRTENGFIEVKPGVDGEVHVHATLRGTDKIDYEVSQDGNTITVTALIDTGWFSDAGADITITTPAVSDLELDTSNGRVEIDGIQGSVDIHSSNGRISLQNVKGDFDASTSNARISVDRMEGTAKLKSSNGAIDLQNVIGEFDASTSSGSISFNGRMIAGSYNRLTSSNGNVNIELWSPVSISLDASTSNGDITCEVPIMATTTEDDHLVGTIGNGETGLYIETSNGDVTIREREVEETPTPSPTPLACKGEGEGIPVIPNPPECCEGLDLIPPKAPDINGITGICTANCGDGVCDSETESEYNCPEDCGG